VRIATLNINNISKRLDNLLAWLAKAQPDVVSLQELKAEQAAFPVNALRTLGYEAVWQGERSWNGVAILARHHVPVLTCTSLPGNPEDHQARYIEAAVQGVLITSISSPMGIRSPDRNSITSWPGLNASLPTPPNSWRPAHPWCSRVTTTSCQLRKTSIRLDRWITTR
jgi:exonuclease III